MLCCSYFYAVPLFFTFEICKIILTYHARAMSSHLKLSLHFKIQYFWCAQMIILSISDLGVSTAILNPVDVFRRWYKLSFWPMRDQVKSRHFSEQTGARRPYFHFLYKYFRIISYKQRGQLFWKLIWIYCYLLNGIGLDLELHYSNLVQKIPNWLCY